MSFASINLDMKVNTPEFWLCRPNEITISTLNEIKNINLSTKVGNLNSLTFSFPSTVLRNHKFVENPLLKKLKGSYLIKMRKDGIVEYFMVTNISKSLSNNDEIVNVQCYNRAYILSKQFVRGLEETSKTLRYLASEVLSDTSWAVDYIDGEVELLHRSFEVGTSTKLQALFDLAEKFNCVIEFDSVNKKVSFKKYENTGHNKGIPFRDGYSLESFNLDIKEEDVVTRLVAYGMDGLEFRSLSPTGANYIQDFSWFMYPFECDEDYNVIKHSDFMSDELCIAILKYNKKLESIGNQFNTLISNRTSKQAQITTAEHELATLETELKIIQSTIDTINATYQDSAPSRADHQQAIAEQAAKRAQITLKTNQLTTLRDELSAIDTQIRELQISISATSNFTQSELDELTDFIRSVDYTNDTIFEEEELLKEAQSVFEDYAQPPLSLSLSIDAFTKYFDTKLIKKLSLGDTIRLKSNSLKVDVKAKIDEINYNYDDMTVSLVVANVRGSMSDDDKFTKFMNQSMNTSTTVSLDKYKWKQGENANTLINQFIESNFDTAKNVLLGGTNNSVEISERGLYNRDLQDSNTYMVINNGILAISPDGGNTVSVAINKNGVIADKLIGRMIMGNKLVLESDSGILESNGTTTTIFDNTKTKRVELGRYVDPSNTNLTKYGLRIYDGAIDIRSSSQENRGTQLDINGFRAFNSNGVRTFDVNSSGQVSIVGSMSIKTSADTNRGVSFDGNGISAYNGSGTRTFYVDTNGQLTASSVNITGIVNATGGTISGNLTVTGTLSGGTISGSTISGATINGGTINVTTDIRVGNNVHIGSADSYESKKVTFNAFSSIGTDRDGNLSLLSNKTNISSFTTEIIGGALTLGNLATQTTMGGRIKFVNGTNINFTGTTINGLTVDYATNANYATSAGSASSVGGWSASNLLKTYTSGLEITRNSVAPKKLSVKVNGSFIGDIELT